MRDFLRRIRLPLIFAALVIATTFFMIGDQRAARGERADAPWPLSVLLEASAPIQRAVRWPFGRVRESWARYVAIVDVGRNNDTLRAHVAALEEENLQLREALVDADNLKRVAAMRKEFEAELMPARVIGQDVSPYFRSLLLDRGRGDRVLSGMAVVSDRGLVGLVTATTQSAARARCCSLIAAPQSTRSSYAAARSGSCGAPARMRWSSPFCCAAPTCA